MGEDLRVGSYQSGYCYFLHDFRPTLDEELQRDVISVATLGEYTWNKMSEEEKKPFNERAEMAKQVAIDRAWADYEQRIAAGLPPLRPAPRNVPWRSAKYYSTQIENGETVIHEFDGQQFTPYVDKRGHYRWRKIKE